MRYHTPVLAALSLAGCVAAEPEPAAPALGSANDLSAFEGARAGQAEMGLQRLGYTPARTEGLVTFWLNQETQACARIETADGRYASVDMVPVAECS